MANRIRDSNFKHICYIMDTSNVMICLLADLVLPAIVEIGTQSPINAQGPGCTT